MTTRFIDHLLTGNHASRPAANAVPEGTLYSCTTHGLIYQSDTSTWSTYATLGVGDATAHIADATDAHDASAVSFDPSGLAVVAGTEVQTAIEELDAAVDSLGATGPGFVYDYAELTSTNSSITATTEAGATTILTGNAVAYDGSTAVLIEFFAIGSRPPAVDGCVLSFYLYDGASSIGRIGAQQSGGVTHTSYSGSIYQPVRLARKLTPSNASHTYGIRCAVTSGTGVVLAGAGGNGADMPAFLRITKV